MVYILLDSIFIFYLGEVVCLLGVFIDDVESDWFNYVRQCLQCYYVVCVLKGVGMFIDNEKKIWVCCYGNLGMVIVGSGDVLSGILGVLFV